MNVNFRRSDAHSLRCGVIQFLAEKKQKIRSHVDFGNPGDARDRIHCLLVRDVCFSPGRFLSTGDMESHVGEGKFSVH